MQDEQFLGQITCVQPFERGMQSEQPIESQLRSSDGQLTATACEVAVAVSGNRGQAIQRAAQYHQYQTRVAGCLRYRELWHAPACSQQSAGLQKVTARTKTVA